MFKDLCIRWYRKEGKGSGKWSEEGKGSGKWSEEGGGHERFNSEYEQHQLIYNDDKFWATKIYMDLMTK